MRVGGIQHVERGIRKHPQLQEPLSAWLRVARDATWASIANVHEVFPTADGVPLRGKGGGVVTVTVFNIGGNKFRLITTISYRAQVLDEWGVLTHAEYDKGKWKRWFA